MPCCMAIVDYNTPLMASRAWRSCRLGHESHAASRQLLHCVHAPVSTYTWVALSGAGQRRKYHGRYERGWGVLLVVGESELQSESVRHHDNKQTQHIVGVLQDRQ